MGLFSKTEAALIRHHWKQLKSFDQAIIFFFLSLNMLILIFHANLPAWRWHLIAHFIICLVILTLVPFLHTRHHPAFYFIRQWYPVVSLPFIYWNVGFFIHLIFPGEFDAEIITMEKSIFGMLPNILVQEIVTPLLTEVMQLFYATYWVIIPAGAAVLHFGKKNKAYDYFLYYVMLTFFISCFVFITFPVAGPRFFIADKISVEYQGLFLTRFLRRFVETAGLRGCAFPSAHVGIGVVVMLFIWEIYPKLAKRVFLPAVVGLTVATVYGQYHYFTDVIAGIAVGGTVGCVGIRHMRISGR